MTDNEVHELSHELLDNYLRTHRLKTSFKQHEVAEVIGYVNRDVISRHERQEAIPSLLVALSYEAFYRVPVSELFTGLAKTAQLKVDARLTEYESYLGEQTAAGPRAAAIARKLEWLSERRNSGYK